MLYVLEILRIGEVCPTGHLVIPELVAALKARGFIVRAYGIIDADIMETYCKAGVSQMKNNFPDKLSLWMNAR